MNTLRCAVMLAGMLVASASEARELRYSLYLPPSSVEGEVLSKFVPELAQRSAGRLTMRVFPGGQLFSGPATLKGIRDGGADMGFVIFPLTVGELKHANIGVDLQLHTSDPYVAMGAVNETVMQSCPKCAGDFDAQNAIYLSGHAAPAFHLMCKSPMKTAADLSGRKVRVTGSWTARLANAFGMVPVQLPGTEIASALSGGQVDCAIAPVVWMRDLQLWDSAKAVLELPLGPSAALGMFVINKRTFNSLDAKDKTVLLDIAADATLAAVEVYDRRDAETRAEAGRKGVVFIKPDDGLLKIVEDFKKNDVPNVVKDMSNRGVTNAEEIAKVHLANVTTWEKIVSDTKGDRKKYMEILKERTMKGLKP